MSKTLVVHPFTLTMVFTVIIVLAMPAFVLAMPAFADETPLQPEFDAAVGQRGSFWFRVWVQLRPQP